MFHLSFFIVLLFHGIHGSDVDVKYSWSNITFNGLDIKSYNPKHNVPTAFAYDAAGHKLFITIPRLFPQVPYTVTELDTAINTGSYEKAPKIKKFSGKSKTDFVSVFQPVIDECRRLWILDVGSVAYNGKDAKKYPKQKAALIVHDLKKNNYPEIGRYVIPDEVSSKPSFFGGYAVDVINPEGDCSKTFVYITNFVENSLVVFDQKSGKSWKFNEKSFEPDKESRFSYKGDQMTYKAGIFGITLGDRKQNGDRRAYYIAGSSTKVYSVNTKQLKTEGAKLKPKLHGDRGEYTDAIALVYDPVHKVIFFAESDSRQVSCWHVNMELKPENTDVVYSDEHFIFGTDISIDSANNLWVMANELPPISDSKKLKSFNRKITLIKGDTKRVLKNSKCNPNYKKP